MARPKIREPKKQDYGIVAVFEDLYQALVPAELGVGDEQISILHCPYEVERERCVLI